MVELLNNIDTTIILYAVYLHNHIKDRLLGCWITSLAQQKNEELWFQNYHLIMYTQELFNNLDNSIDEYLLPDSAKKDVQKNAYRDFYRKNLQAKKAMVISIAEVCEELHEYLDIRFEEAAR